MIDLCSGKIKAIRVRWASHAAGHLLFRSFIGTDDLPILFVDS